MSPVKMGLVGAAALIGIGVAIPVIGMITQPFRTAQGVVGRTMDADNVLRTYELFHDRWNGFEARIRQVNQTAKDLAAETNPAEKIRLRVELGAQRQSCRDIAAAYNADAIKTNRSIFQGRDAPATLDMERCG